jgi:hypothetical protein
MKVNLNKEAIEGLLLEQGSSSQVLNSVLCALKHLIHTFAALLPNPGGAWNKTKYSHVRRRPTGGVTFSSNMVKNHWRP